MGQFSVKTYNPPGSLLSATQHLGGPNVKLWRSLIDDMPPLVRTRRQRLVIKTSAVPAPTDELLRDLSAYGIEYSDRSSRRLSAGDGLRAVFGRRIGRVRILELPWSKTANQDEAVPRELGVAIINLLIRRRNAELNCERDEG